MSQTAANVVDQVVPHVPVRQCVLSLSIPPRPPLTPQPKLLTPVPHDGLAVDGHRPLLGPVLRGWSALLEIAIEARGNQLHQVPLDNSGTMLRKHFLQLDAWAFGTGNSLAVRRWCSTARSASSTGR